ncbi:nucleotidyl transferase AbiEii/AbiGii toxin family protein [Actinomadura welshii]
MSAYGYHRAGPSLDEPAFGSPEERARWHEVRRRVLGHVLAAVSESTLADSLVLRGSVLLRAWFGERAREPGDIDFVVVPPELEARGWASHLRYELVKAVLAVPCEGVEILTDSAEQSELWPYTDSPGMRLRMPWEADGELRGTLQIDFSFGKRLRVGPELSLVPVPGGAGGPREVPLYAATPGLSLAWKVHWLLVDRSPHPKDLYDAWLLAAHVRFEPRLLGEPNLSRRKIVRRIEQLAVAADEWHEACPGAEGAPARFVRELAARLSDV